MEQDPHDRDGSNLWDGAVVDEATGGELLGLLACVAIDLLSSNPGISIIGRGRRRTLCARPPIVDGLDLVQIDRGGPSMDAMSLGTTQEAVLSEHLSHWAELERQSREIGYSSIHAFPILGSPGTLGTLNLYSTTRRLTDRDVHIATGISRAAASVIARTRAPELIDRREPRRIVSELSATLERIGATPDELFVRYFAIGGMNTRSHVDAVMTGRTDGSADDLDTIDLAVDELVDEHLTRRRDP